MAAENEDDSVPSEQPSRLVLLGRCSHSKRHSGAQEIIITFFSQFSFVHSHRIALALSSMVASRITSPSLYPTRQYSNRTTL